MKNIPITTKTLPIITMKEPNPDYKEIRRLEGCQITTLAFSPDGQWLAMAERVKSPIYLWSLANRTLIKKLGYPETDFTKQLAFSPDSRYLAIGTMKDLTIWDIVRDQKFLQLKTNSRVLQLSFSHSGELLAMVTRQQFDTVQILDIMTGVQTGQELHKFASFEYIEAITFSPDDQFLAVGLEKGFWVYDLQANAQINYWEKYRHKICALCFTPDGQKLLTASSTGAIETWNWKTGEQEKFVTPKIHDIRLRVELRQHSNFWDEVTFSSDGKYLVTGCRGYEDISFFDTSNGKEVRLQGHSGGVYGVALSADGKILASTSEKDNTVRVWDLTPTTRTTGKRKR